MVALFLGVLLQSPIIAFTAGGIFLLTLDSMRVVNNAYDCVEPYGCDDPGNCDDPDDYDK